MVSLLLLLYSYQQDTVFLNMLFLSFFPYQASLNSVVMTAVEQAGLPFNPAKVDTCKLLLK